MATSVYKEKIVSANAYETSDSSREILIFFKEQVHV